MDATFKSIHDRHRKGVFFSTNTNQKISISSQLTKEGKLACKVCKKEFLVPSNITTYRCYACQGVLSKPSSDYEQSRNDNRANLLKHNADINGIFLSNSSNSTGSSSSLSVRCNKRAVLCGVTYGKRKFRLKGTVNDVIDMKELLVKNFKFPMDCIRLLTEEENNPDLIPTRRNIMESLKWLVKDCKSGDSLVFYFSGHGLQQPEFHKHDEIDGFDETICPVDFMKEGVITDNELNSTIVSPLVKGVTLHAIIDACHSGTTLDLVYVWKQKNGIWNWEDDKPGGENPINKHTSGGLAICLSACEDSQMAADTSVFGGKGMNGVMTYLFTKIIREQPGITYGGLLEKMHGEIRKIHQSKWYNSILKHIVHPKIEQDPLLSSSGKFDVSRRRIAL
ncbi:putative Caspase-like domain-containing protein [Lupinus albus]|uniref:Putative Caspase-like domain-containing protein n=1 Tax=Lupinus albus TaxID=3870 RepID=A0A6A4PEY9_LUPAL|nr:putative Caspase-like domain-containing protein [Lupinus albus]